MTPKEHSTAPHITLIRGGWLAAWDGERHQVVERGEVVFRGGEIIYAGDRYEGEVDEVLDRPEWFICPGFINLHAHVGVEVMGPFVDLSPEQRFALSREAAETLPLNLAESLSSEQQQLSAEFHLVQSIRTGTTTIVDAAGSGTVWFLGNPPGDVEMLAETVGRVGSRAYLSLSYRSARRWEDADGSDGWHWDDEMGMDGLAQAVEFATSYRGRHDGRIQTLLTPHQADNCSPELLAATLEAARANDILIEIHAAEYPFGATLVRERYGETQVGYLASQGFLGPDIILGHCMLVSGHPEVELSRDDPDRDLRLIGEAGSSVAHSPWVLARKGQALHSLPRYRDHGITVGIGCDLWPADIIREMRLAWLMGKATSRDALRPTCAEVFHAATVGSADALQRPDLGRLAPGAQADIVCVDLSGYHFGPVLDPIRSLVTLGDGRDVDAVYVAGERIVENGRVLNADEKRLKAAAPEILDQLHRIASERDPQGQTAQSILDGGS